MPNLSKLFSLFSHGIFHSPKRFGAASQTGNLRMITIHMKIQIILKKIPQVAIVVLKQ